jgi:hypothetical protein
MAVVETRGPLARSTVKCDPFSKPYLARLSDASHCKGTTTLNTLFTELRYPVNKVTLSVKFVTLFTINSMV